MCYKADDTKLGRTVALKLLPQAVNQDPNARRRFLNEAQSASALNHPNIVIIHAIEEAGGLDFIVMEYVEGQTLKRMIVQDGALPFIEAPSMLESRLPRLWKLRTLVNVIHRDIKSANVSITPRGIAKSPRLWFRRRTFAA
mgnify:CR=1 FL=1